VHIAFCRTPKDLTALPLPQVRAQKSNPPKTPGIPAAGSCPEYQTPRAGSSACASTRCCLHARPGGAPVYAGSGCPYGDVRGTRRALCRAAGRAADQVGRVDRGWSTRAATASCARAPRAACAAPCPAWPRCARPAARTWAAARGRAPCTRWPGPRLPGWRSARTAGRPSGSRPRRRPARARPHAEHRAGGQARGGA